VYLSTQGGVSGSYDPLSLRDENVSLLEVEQKGPNTYLWAGLAVKSGTEAGKGAARWELQDGSPGTHVVMTKGWVGGSCHGLAFSGDFAFAATHDNGVLWLELTGEQSTWSWRAPLKGSGLKIRESDTRFFEPVTALAAASQLVSDLVDPKLSPVNIVMAGGDSGIFRSVNNGTGYEKCSSNEFLDKVTISQTWLFVSGKHEVTVVSEDDKI
jgi:hypothetical protein